MITKTLAKLDQKTPRDIKNSNNNNKTPRVETFESVMERLKKTPSVSPNKLLNQRSYF